MKARFILISIIIIFLSVLVNQNFIKYVYVSPHVNTSALKHITKVIKPIEKNLKQIIEACQKEHKEMKYAYVDYYGSGFLKENPIPNDLDVSVCVDLGTYEYNGENLEEIAKDLVSKIELFHVYTIVVFYDDEKNNYVIKRPDLGQYNEIQQKKQKSLENVKTGLQLVLDNKNSILHFNKKFKGKPIDYTYILDKNEVWVNDLSPFFAYTKGVIYNNQTVDYPREITILPDFCATIKNTKTNEIKEIELVEEYFIGIRFQLPRRFFAPIVFTGNNSLEYIKKLDYLNDDKKYIETRIFNFFRYLNEAELYLEAPINNVKLVKRLHQCADIISPALSEEEKTKIYSDISTTLSNENVQLVNDYITSLKSLIYMTSNAYIYSQAKKRGYINDLVKVMEDSFEKLNKNNNSEVEFLKEYQKCQMLLINAIEKEKFRAIKSHIKFLDRNFIKASKDITKMISNPENKQKLNEDYKILKNIFDKAGLHKIEIYSSDLKKFYIVKDKFTKNLTSSDLKQLAKENNLPDVEYKLLDNLDKRSRGELKIVRYKPTEAQEKYWQELQNKLLEDKKNYKIKRKYLF